MTLPRRWRWLAAAALLAVAGPAAAESGRWGSFELQLGKYRPRIDSEFGGTGPFQAIFGGGSRWFVQGAVAKSLFVDYGALDLGVGVGYTERYGRGLLLDGTRSADSTSLKIIPTRLSLTYRFDVVARAVRWLPLAPYGRVSLERYNWWVNAGSGNTAHAGGRSGYGATNGWSASGGVALLLDSIDPTLAREMDRDTGINNTYLFVDFTRSFVSDFGSKTSWDLSDDSKVTISGGLLFVF